MTPWDLSQALADYDQGLSFKDLERKYGLAYSKIRQNFLESPNFKPRSAGRPRGFTNEGKTLYSRKDFDIDKIFEDWASGLSTPKLSKIYGPGSQTILSWIKGHPRYEEVVQVRGGRHTKRQVKGARSRIDYEEANRLYAETDMTCEQIGELYGVRRSAIDSIIRPEAKQQRRDRILAEFQRERDAIESRKSLRRNIQDLYREALAYYRDGFTVRELGEHYPELNMQTFTNTYLPDARAADPTFPSERGIDGRDYNWAKRTIKALEVCDGKRSQAARMLQITDAGMNGRIKLLKARGLL